MSTIKHVILASASPFRRALLTSTGLTFAVQVAPIDEAAVGGRTSAEVAKNRSVAKALAVAERFPEALVIGADQVLSLDGEPLDKVASAAEAKERLTRMAGRSHILHSGLALAFGKDDAARTLAATVVDVSLRMRPLSDPEIAAYVATGEWQGSVGCYQFENRGIHLLAGPDGPAADQSTIIGLPLVPLMDLLRRHGVDGLLAPDGPWTLRV